MRVTFNKYWAKKLYHSFIHSLISVSDHYECVAPNVDIILQSG